MNQLDIKLANLLAPIDGIFTVTFDAKLLEDGTHQRVEILEIFDGMVRHNGMAHGLHFEMTVEELENTPLFINYTNTRLILPQFQSLSMIAEGIKNTQFNSCETDCTHDAGRYAKRLIANKAEDEKSPFVSIALHVGKFAKGGKWFHQSWAISYVDQQLVNRRKSRSVSDNFATPMKINVWGS
jgi:hypothetical protein